MRGPHYNRYRGVMIRIITEFYCLWQIYSSHQVQPCSKKMKKSEENFYCEKKYSFLPKKNFFSSQENFFSLICDSFY